ncbi:hypothetical protein JCM5353_006465 [Sporobolomyces roseus]
METDYDSPPRPHTKIRKNKKQYGKKARRMTAAGVGGNQLTEKAGRKESSESDEIIDRGKGRGEIGKGKEGKGKGKEIERREGRKGNRKEESTREDRAVAENNGKSRVRESISSQRQFLSRSRKSQPILLAPQASSSSSSSRKNVFGGTSSRTEPVASTSRLSCETDLALPQCNAQSSASDFEPAPVIKKKRLSRASLTPQSFTENAHSQLSRTSSIESLTSKFDKTFPPTSIQAFRASTVSPRLSAFSDKSNFPPSTSNARISHSQSTTNSPRLTDFPPPTLPRFTRSHSTRLSLSQPRASPKSSSKLSVFQDEPLATLSTTSTSSRPSLPAPSNSKRLSLSQFPSLSPSSFTSNTSKPTFRFTTTTFPDAPPSPTLALGLKESEFGIGGGGGKEAEGAGMESTFLLESWDANNTVLSQDPVEVTEEEKEEVRESGNTEEGEKVMEDEIEMEEDKGGFEFADETNSTIRGGGCQESSVEMTVQQEETNVLEEKEEEGVKEEVRSNREGSVGVPEILEMPRGVEDSDDLEFEEESDRETAYEAEDSNGSSQQQDPTKSSDSDHSSSSPPLRPIYTASFLPPRRPRSLSHPLKLSRASYSPPKIPSDEDDLAFLIRTTATHSSEDDLPPLSSDLSSDERSFRLAEREIGRGTKTSSNQRGKRVALRDKLRGLKIGQGKEGRRLGWKREIIDLTGENEEDEEEEGDDELALSSLSKRRSGAKQEENVET